jgi:hydroxymethylpyrimidine pyrophosphatase-like HAD family hydrolase
LDVKLIAIDLNGTLLNTHNKISKQSIDTIKMAQEKGIEIAIATRD